MKQSFAQTFQFAVGDAINVTADKGYRYGTENRFEVLGNVVMTHFDEILYGETGSLNLDTGLVVVKGNVRYIAPGMTLYGSQLDFNIKTNFLTIQNSKVVSQGYTIQGERISRVAPNIFLAEEAEYTTCRDCPESWSIYGKKVRIIQNEYVHIQNALIKINGVSVMYTPYMVVPIKKGRQTGLLFPEFSLSLQNGFQYKQPWFWAINESSDMTLSPLSMGMRGLGTEVEYRKTIGEGKWLEFDSILGNDRIYVPNRLAVDSTSGEHYFRNFSNYEHHYQIGNFFSHHFFYQNARDLDVVSDYERFTRPFLTGSEFGAGTFFNFKSEYYNGSLETYFNRNLMVPEARKFDHAYVQLMPRLSLGMVPINIIRLPWLLRNVAVGGDISYSYFKQNHVATMINHSENPYIYNAHRVVTLPYLDISLGSLGPIDFKTNIEWEFQYYKFPFEKKEKSFFKKGTVLISEMNFEIDKVYGLAYIEKIPLKQINLEETENKESLLPHLNNKQTKQTQLTTPLIGSLPDFDKSKVDDIVTISYPGYRHSMIFNFRHHYTANQQYSGSSKFANQVKDGAVIFDYQDSPRKLRHILGSLSTRTDISQRNTLEFRLFNSLFRKNANSQDNFYSNDPNIRNQFTYSKMAYINLSQGLELNTKEDRLIDNLTRLYLSSGFPLLGWDVSMSDYYFYLSQKHQFNLALTKRSPLLDFSLGLQYDSLPEISNKNAALKFTLRPIDVLHFNLTYQRNLTQQTSNMIGYDLLYLPWNNCWRFNLGYTVTPFDKQIFINFEVNFSEGVFVPLLKPATTSRLIQSFKDPGPS